MVRQAHHERLKIPRVLRIHSKLTDRCTDEASLNIGANMLEATKGWVMNLLTAV
jgi:hypothetical protein